MASTPTDLFGVIKRFVGTRHIGEIKKQLFAEVHEELNFHFCHHCRGVGGYSLPYPDQFPQVFQLCVHAFLQDWLDIPTMQRVHYELRKVTAFSGTKYNQSMLVQISEKYRVPLLYLSQALRSAVNMCITDDTVQSDNIINNYWSVAVDLI
jgi:hypothetical protein